jgi:glycosyltransferase involved in cell wall biosynthesis
LQERSELWVLSEVFRDALPMAPTVHVVANGVSCRAAVHDSRSVRDDSLFGVVFLGNHFMIKGVDTTAELATRMVDAPVQWTFAGASVELATEVMLSRVAGAGVRFDRVKHVDAEVRCQLLSSASCLLMPSRATEAAPLVVVEALNHGVVPIVSDSGALREMVDGVGYVCRDLDDYESALWELIDDPTRLHDLSQRARTRWAERYTGQLFQQRVRDLLCGRDGRSR